MLNKSSFARPPRRWWLSPRSPDAVSSCEDKVAGDQGATARVSPGVIPEVLERDLQEGAGGPPSAPSPGDTCPTSPLQHTHLPGPAVGHGILPAHHPGRQVGRDAGDTAAGGWEEQEGGGVSGAAGEGAPQADGRGSLLVLWASTPHLRSSPRGGSFSAPSCPGGNRVAEREVAGPTLAQSPAHPGPQSDFSGGRRAPVPVLIPRRPV